MRVVGPESSEDRALREWFATLKRGSVERLEAGAQLIIQLVTGLYGVLFAVLALSDSPTYLQRTGIQVAGTLALCAFFAALIAAMWVIVPSLVIYQQDNLTSMERAHDQMLTRKVNLLLTSQFIFILGIAALLATLIMVIWNLGV